MFDGKAFGEQMVEVVKSYVDEATVPLLKRIEAQDREIEALKKRAPERGEPGPAGRDGVDGQNGADGAAGADGRDGIDGKDGADGAPGEPGSAGERGLDGKDGRDGVGVAGAIIDRGGNLILTMSDGSTRDLGRVEGKDGQNGERGPAGFSLRDFDTEFRHEDKVLVLKFAGEDALETHEIFLPYVRDMGVWKEGTEYLEGDGVTWGGSFWTAQKTTSGKPDDGDWRLAVKRGRDGKDFAGPQTKAPATVKI
jgi:integrin beta 3